MPALNHVYDTRMPDGSTLKVRSIGNEILNYKVTEDGYAVARDSLGFFCYLNEDGSVSKVRARDREKRTKEELKFISILNKNNVIYELERSRGKREYQNFKMLREGVAVDTQSSSVPMLRMPKVNSNLTDGVEKKALVILVQFSDVKFSDVNPKEEFDNYLNQEGYSVSNNIGSVRDYFIANSSGKFVPRFDVVGPVTLPNPAYTGYGPYSRYGNEGVRKALSQALDTLKNWGIDFKQYDNDGNRELDFVHMIYAGIGSNDTEQDSAMWPHMWYMSAQGQYTIGQRQYVSGSAWNGYYVDAYSCSNELDGMAYAVGKKIKVGVGPFIHEFGHVLGLGDLYSSEDIYTLGNWDVMDGGAYNCPNQNYPISCAPPYYSAFERMFLGWMTPTEIYGGTGVQLPPVSENRALKVFTGKTDEFYILEYRDRKGWDVGLPNHGMLIWHIDYDSTAWFYGQVNTSTKMRVDIIEADGKADQNTAVFDVFPGGGRTWGGWSYVQSPAVTSFDQFVTASGMNLGISISNIAESSDYSYVFFDVNGANLPASSSSVESSSSWMLVSSSSEESSSSAVTSSSSFVPTSSFSVMPPSSSSNVWPEVSVEPTSSFCDEDFVHDGVISRIIVSWVGNQVTLSGMPRGDKILRVFSLNGNLLLSRQVETSDFILDVNRYFGKTPVILQVASSGRVILRRLLK